jgi:hypothetical protein
VTAPESLTYGRHAISARRQHRRDVAYQLDDWLIQHYHAVQVVVLALGVLTATVVAFAATGHPMTAIALGLAGGLAVAIGISIAATGGGRTDVSVPQGHADRVEPAL